jgi:hypothetical protein
MNSTGTRINLMRFSEVFVTLWGDTVRAQSALVDGVKTKQVLDQFWARTMLRSFFAFVEGITYELKLVIEGAVDDGMFDVSHEEWFALLEFTYELDSDGKVHQRPRFVALERQLRFVFQLAARLFGCEPLPLGDARFDDFRRSLHLRNSITHPKDPDALKLRPEDIHRVIRGMRWFADVLVLLHERWKEQGLIEDVPSTTDPGASDLPDD